MLYTIRAGVPLPGGRLACTFHARRPTRPAAMRVAAGLPDDPNHALVEVAEYAGYIDGAHVTTLIARRTGGTWVTDAMLLREDPEPCPN